MKSKKITKGIAVMIVTIVVIALICAILLSPWDLTIVIYAIIIVSVLSIVWLSDRENKRSLQKARKFQKMFVDRRDLLEMKIAERTAELKKSQAERAIDLSRNAEFGRLSQGLFHDLMTPLASVALHVEKMQSIQGTQEVQETAEHMLKAIHASKKMNSFMQNIRRHLQQTRPEDISSNLNTEDNREDTEIARASHIAQEAERVISVLSYQARQAGIEIEVVFEDFIYPANPFHFYQIFLNLVSNSIAAHADDKKYARPSAQEKPKYVKIEILQKKIIVSDNGPGISPKNIDRIFRPFFTTKSVDQGTGIGLHTVKTIVEEKLGGKITVTSRENIETIFTIELP